MRACLRLATRGLALASLLATLGCNPGPDHLPDMALYADAVDSMRSVITQTGVAIDPAVSTDGRGSLRIDAKGGRTVVELADVPIDAPELPRLSYRAKLRCQDLAGVAYLEMWVKVEGLGDFFSRALHSQVSGTGDWSTHEAPFFLEPGQVPKRAKLNVVVEGTGTVWVDGITLSAGKR